VLIQQTALKIDEFLLREQRLLLLQYPAQMGKQPGHQNIPLATWLASTRPGVLAQNIEQTQQVMRQTGP
jgi:hypothetical protein